MIRKLLYLTAILLFLGYNTAVAQQSEKRPEYSKAGFFELPNSGRNTLDFNVGWHFHKGSVQGAEQLTFNDSQWQVVNTPHTTELVSTQASGSNNYQGESWYRKHFVLPDSLKGKQITIYFEAVMGKCKIWFNGELLKTHYGGYLPFSIDITNKIKEKNVVAVWADNQDDTTYPPGKSQKQLDFSYFGGIYRDVWLIATNKIYITDPNKANKKAGGGTLVHFKNISTKSADIIVQTDVMNGYSSKKRGHIQYILRDKNGKIVYKKSSKIKLLEKSDRQFIHNIKVKNPKLWSPQSPYLYHLEISIIGRHNKSLDGVRQKIGIRKIEFRGKDGLYLNNQPYRGKLIGANRHQDYAYLGNALPNAGQWRDALLLKSASCNVVRAAHYPADPAFMDACDSLGLFFIVATPGWQFWNNQDQIFEQRVYQDIRNMVRRDRNHAAAFLWEPILNETYYPDHFAENVHNLVHEEFPFENINTVCDRQAKGQEYFDVVYSHPYKGDFFKTPEKNTSENRAKLQIEYNEEERCLFTREWGDCVDDWNAHNSPSRAARNWGEKAQMVQAQHYANPTFVYTSWEALYNAPRQHIGGALWHAFDHQRGYHPDPFYGGITDLFRQPKYAYYLFKSQRTISESGPMIYMAHEMTPFSPADITVFSNCDEVRLIVYEKDTLTVKRHRSENEMPNPIVVFKNVFDFIDLKRLHRQNKKQQANIVAQGLVNGKVVVSTKKMAALRTARIHLQLANQGIPLTANGSDVITVVASVVDENGNVKRLNNDIIKFDIEGEGTIIGDEKIAANPKPIEWGTAPIIVKSTTRAGKITVKASVLCEGVHTPIKGSITFESVPSDMPLLFSEEAREEQPTLTTNQQNSTSETVKQLKANILQLKKEIHQLKLKEVERQQQDFEGKEH